MVRVTLSPLDVRLPPASRMRTVTAGVIVSFDAVVVGCTPNASFAAAPVVILKAALVAPVKDSGVDEVTAVAVAVEDRAAERGRDDLEPVLTAGAVRVEAVVDDLHLHGAAEADEQGHACEAEQEADAAVGRRPRSPGES